jgi:hypothetical protein
VFPLTVFTALLDNVFKQWTFRCSRAHILAGWRSSHANLLVFCLRLNSKSELSYYRQSVGQSVLGSILTWDPRPDFYYCQTLAVLLMWGTPQTRGRVCPFVSGRRQHKSLWGPRPAGLMVILYSLKFETSPTRRARSLYLYSQRTGWPSYTPRHW